MKKFLAILLVCLMLCALFTACGGNEEETTTAADLIGDVFEDGSDEYYVPEPDGGTASNDQWELGGVPLT